MDFVPSNMIANSTSLPPAASAAAAPGTLDFAALLSMVEQAAAGAASPPASEDGKSAGPGINGGSTLPGTSKLKAAPAQPPTSRKSEPDQSADSGLAVLVPARLPTLVAPALDSVTQATSLDNQAANDASAVSAPAELQLEPSAILNRMPLAVATATETTRDLAPYFQPVASTGGLQNALVAKLDPASESPSSGVDLENASATDGASESPSTFKFLAPRTATETEPREKPAAGSAIAPEIMAQPRLPDLARLNVVQPSTLSVAHPASPSQPAPAVSTAASAPAKHSTSSAQAAEASPRSISGVSDLQAANSVSELKQVIAAVTATTAHAAGREVAHAAIKVPATTSKVTQPGLADSHSPLPITGKTSAQDADPKSHSAPASERGKKDSGALAQHNVEPVSTAAETPANNASNELAVAQPKVAPSPVPGSAAQPSVTENHESQPALSQAAPGATRATAPQDLPHTALLVNSASLQQQMDKSELRLGMRVGDFGQVEIRTQMDRQQLRAEISVEHRDLGHALTAELPSLQQKLHDHDVPVISLNLTGHGAGGSSSQGGPRDSSPAPVQAPAGFAIEKTTEASSSPGPGETDAKSGLDIRV